MEKPSRAYRAICFDLDGTLLPMDIDEFMGAYLKGIADFAAAHGLDAKLFMEALKIGTRAMATHTGDETNEEAYWEAFYGVYGEAGDVRTLVDGFYRNDFAKIGAGFVGHPAVPRVIAKLRELGYPLVLTTMPMFPLAAVEQRLSWAGLEAASFARITSYSNSKSVKPRASYYAENLAALGLSGDDVLMVGNNTLEDLAFMELGADAFLVTDWLLDPVDFDLAAVKHGAMDEFEAWVNALPACENPVSGIAPGAIDAALTCAALAQAAPGAESAQSQAAGAAAAGNVLDGYMDDDARKRMAARGAQAADAARAAEEGE